MTDGGQVLHLDDSCDALKMGQEEIRERGGVPSPIRQISLAEAVETGRRYCRSCGGQDAGRMPRITAA
jgi:hypothetical protein